MRPFLLSLNVFATSSRTHLFFLKQIFDSIGKNCGLFSKINSSLKRLYLEKTKEKIQKVENRIKNVLLLIKIFKIKNFYSLSKENILPFEVLIMTPFDLSPAETFVKNSD